MLQMSVAQTSEIDGEPAAAALLEQCRATLGELEPQAGLLMASHDLELEDFCRAIYRAYPDLRLLGCTTIAPMSSAADYYEGASTLSLFASDTLEFSVGVGFPRKSGSDGAAREALAQAMADRRQEPALCLAVTSVEGLDPIELTNALDRALGDNVVLFGGGATPDLPMSAMWSGSAQILNREILSDSLPILLISGPLKLSVGVGHGWTPAGREAVVTRSESGRILEIDCRPAVEFYQHYLGETPVAALAAPLAIYEGSGEGHYLRAPIRFDDEGAAVVQGRVPEGSRIRITLSSTEEIVGGAGLAAARALGSYPTGYRPEAALVSSCAIRNVLLGGRSAREIVSIRDALGEDIPIQGLYAYGEIAPLEHGGDARFHNHTCCTVLIGT